MLEALAISEAASECAAPVIDAIVHRTSAEVVKERLYVQQRALIHALVGLANRTWPLDARPVIWVNAYYAQNLENLDQAHEVDVVDAPEEAVIYKMAAIRDEDQPLVDQIQTGLTTGVTEQPAFLSDVLGHADSPTVVRFRIDRHGAFSARTMDGRDWTAWDELKPQLQWYRDLLFPGALDAHPERRSWCYVHLGPANRERLPVNAMGAYLMLRSEEDWLTLRPLLLPGLRTFLDEIALAHVWYRIRQRHRKSMRAYADLAHEFNAICNKHFARLGPHLQSQGGWPGHAWNVVRSMASLLGLQAKARNDAEQIHAVRKRFSDPFRALMERGALEDALVTVAHSVIEHEGPATGQGLRGGVDLPPRPTSLRIEDLSPEEHVACYCIVAEPIRNHLHHGKDPAARWTVRVSREDGIEVELRGTAGKFAESMPRSATFDALDALLQDIDPKGFSKAVSRLVRPEGVWTVTVSPKVLEEE